MKPQAKLLISPAEALAGGDFKQKSVPIIGQAHPLDAWLKLLELRLLRLSLLDPHDLEKFLESRRHILLETMSELLSAERARVTLIHQKQCANHGTEVEQFSSACLVAINQLGLAPPPKER